jgi:hypothetical protein
VKKPKVFSQPLSKALAETLQEMGVKLITTRQKNRKAVALTPFEKALLKQRSLIETVFDELKNRCQIEHTRHRSLGHFLVYLRAGIVADGLSETKPSWSLIQVNALTKA